MTIEVLQDLLHQAEAAEALGNYDEAERLSRQILTSLTSSGEADTEYTKLQAGANRVLGVVCWRRGEYSLALERLQATLQANVEMNDQAGMSKTLGNIGNVHGDLSDYPKALEYYGKALSLAEELGYTSRVAIHLGNIGGVHLNLSDYPKALEYYGKALGIDKELGDKAGVAIWLGNIGNVYSELSDYAKALELYGKALVLAEELGYKRGVAINLGNIGNVTKVLLDYPKALECYGQALGLAEELGNKSEVANHLGNIGNVHADLNDYAKALECYGQALSIAEELGNKSGVARHLGNIGLVHMILSDYPNAQEYLNRSLSLQEELGRKSGVVDIKGSLGDLYASDANPNRDESIAEVYLLDSIAMSEELGTKKYAAHKTLADLYEKQDRWKESHYHQGKYFALKEEVQSDEARKKAQLMEQQKQIADREKEIAIAKAAADAQMSATTTLLYKVLPQSVATRLIEGEEEIADYHTNISILFADIVGFTPIAAQMQARDVMSLLNYVFGEFDRIMEKHGCQKIKTMGDGYMAVCGAPIPYVDHAERLANAALDLLADIELPESLRSSLPKGSVFHLRIRLHCGPAFAGIVGEKGFVYDVYSDAVNLASRMESHGEPGKIHCSEEFVEQLGRHVSRIAVTERGEIDVKGKGIVRTYFLSAASSA